jgi:hypothetical protein
VNGSDAWGVLPHAVGQGLSCLRDFFTDSECTLDIANTYTVCTRWVYYRILMEYEVKGDFTDGEIRAINRCRLFIQVECLSDVCTADGLTTDPGLQAHPPKVTSYSTNKCGPVKDYRASARGQYGDRTHVISRTTCYARSRGHAPPFGFSPHAMIRHRNFAARWCFSRQMHRSVPLAW